MKNREASNDSDYRSLLILDEISKNQELTQLELSKGLGIAVGLVNSYIKNLVNKGYITVSAIPKRRYIYYLTPRGFIEKSRLTYHHLQNFTNLYRVARRDFRALFEKVSEANIKRLAFCGVDEVAEIAYLSLQETGIELENFVIFDDSARDKKFFNHELLSLEKAKDRELELIVITSFKDGEALKAKLLAQGIAEEKIVDISRGGWMNNMEAREEGL